MDYGYSEEEQWKDKTPCVNLLPQNLSISEVISKHDLFIYTLMGVRDGLKSEPLLFQFAFSLTHAGRLFHHVFSSILTICSLLQFFTQQRNR